MPVIKDLAQAATGCLDNPHRDTRQLCMLGADLNQGEVEMR